MASEFIGFKITVTLTSPPNGKLQGIVANVVGQQLFLRDGRMMKTLGLGLVLTKISPCFLEQSTIPVLCCRFYAYCRPRGNAGSTRRKHCAYTGCSISYQLSPMGDCADLRTQRRKLPSTYLLYTTDSPSLCRSSYP